MALDFAGLKAAVLALSPSQVSPAGAGDAVNRAYQTLLDSRPGGGVWFGLQTSYVETTDKDKIPGTISLSKGSNQVVGVGTNFAIADSGLGRYLVVGDIQPIRVVQVTSPTLLLLESNWGEPSIANTGYKLIQLRYQLPADGLRIIRMAGPMWRLERRNINIIDEIDPNRQQRGQPLVWAEVELSNELVEYELWPVPDVAYTLRVTYRKTTPDLALDTDVPVLSPQYVMQASRAEMCGILHSRTGDEAWAERQANYDGLAGKILESLLKEDRRMRGAHPVALDTDDIGGQDSASWWRAWRLQSTLAAGSIA